MELRDVKKNEQVNRDHYEKVYSKINIDSILKKINNLEEFLEDATIHDTSWVGLYSNNFKEKFKNKKVLELGCGDCTNAAVMAALGAEVVANDISSVSGEIINQLNKRYPFKKPLKFIEGDFLKADIPDNTYDLIVGKAFVHHLTHEQEIEFTKKIARILKKDGMVRYFEPAVNNKFLDELRWLIPVPGRPSKLQKDKFEEWLKNDPHPIRDNSSGHYQKIGDSYFESTDIIPLGSIERFHRILPKGKYNRKFRGLAFKLEKMLPSNLNLFFARSQVITYASPKALKTELSETTKR